jgi:hypothetical protein
MMAIPLQHLAFWGICFDILGAMIILTGAYISKRNAAEMIDKLGSRVRSVFDSCLRSGEPG